MKNFISASITFLAIMLALFVTSCNSDKSMNSSDTAQNTALSQESDNSSQAGSAESDSSDPSSQERSSSDSASKKLLSVIKDAYGENYLPDMEVPEEEISGVYGLEADSYTDAAGEVSSGGSDEVLIVKAKSGGSGDIKAALSAYRDRLIFQSGSDNVAASQIVTDHDYIMLIMLEDNEIGITAFRDYFKSDNS